MKIVIATGGTGGHMIPAVKTAQILRDRGHTVIFIGSFRMGTGVIEQNGFPVYDIGSRGLNSFHPYEIVRFLTSMVQGFFRAISMTNKIDPDGVAGFGGYPAFPVVAAAMFIKIPALIHEQNVVPGRANRLLAPYVKRICLSFSDSRRYFPDKKTVVTGCPCNLPVVLPSRKDVLKAWGLRADLPTILVFGGSQGSRTINQKFCAAAKIVTASRPIQVIHVAGKEKASELKSFYSATGVPCLVFEYCRDMPNAYAAADVVIARAGALTVTELGRLGKRCVLIPYPYAGGHQRNNAEVLERRGLACVIEERNLSAERLATALIEGLKRSAEPTLSDPIKKIFAVEPEERLADEIESLV
jgi:UDP-N-acetylglucosamine--N-acetylmuramyl-(pentapeptide) pyrophosphoryl-undecaprenol N-acetylglucosamine transferase